MAPRKSGWTENRTVPLNELESHLWEAANILRGPVDAADFKTYVFPLPQPGHDQGFLTSLQFLKEMLELSKEFVEAEKEVDPVEDRDHAKEALTELFEEAKGRNNHIIVKRILAGLVDNVQKVRSPDWQHTTRGEHLVQKELRLTLLKCSNTSPHGSGTFRQSLRLHPAVLLNQSHHLALFTNCSISR